MSIFRPTYSIRSIYDLDQKQLKQLGVKTVFSDLDNTLLAWNQKDAIAKLVSFNHYLTAHGIELIVISNNNQHRVAQALDPLGVKFIARAKKPLPSGIRRGLAYFHYQPSEVLMVGDQLITDIQAGNLAGVRTVLVQPLVATDAWNTSINRFLEKFIFLFLNLKKRIIFKERLSDRNN